MLEAARHLKIVVLIVTVSPQAKRPEKSDRRVLKKCTLSMLFIHSKFLCTVIFVARVVDLSVINSLSTFYDGLAT